MTFSNSFKIRLFLLYLLTPMQKTPSYDNYFSTTIKIHKKLSKPVPNKSHTISCLLILLINSMSNNQTQKITICTINNDQKEISVPTSYTGYQLKQYIFKNVTQSLNINDMKIYYAGVKIEDDKVLSSYKMIQGSAIKMLQTKCDIDEIPGLIVSYEQDQISLEEKTARMPCGHVIGRDCMTQFIRSLVQANLFTITCPSYKPNGQKCTCEWDYALCRKIGVFTSEEILQFQTGLSKNWMIKNTIECPNCRQNLYKDDLQIDRVKCPKCQYGDFCACCLRKWLSNNNDYCGNQGCSIVDSFLQTSPWTKNFELKQNNKIIKIKCPMHRACPKCAAIIQHTSGCKHMECKACKTNFCWVCLGVKQNNSWKCGSHSNYCGTIAQTQVVAGIIQA